MWVSNSDDIPLFWEEVDFEAVIVSTAGVEIL